MSDYDSPWKDALERFFRAFMEFFFPEAAALIDWSQPVQFMDKELQRILPSSDDVGLRIVDKLAKVGLLSGQERWVLVHVEVQGDPESEFARRMYVCNYRLFDGYNQMAASFAVLADMSAQWRPQAFDDEALGCSVSFRFPMVKLLDFGREPQDWDRLEASNNPFAVLTMAHLKTKETLHDPATRRQWKLRIIKGMYRRGWSRDDILSLFRVIDWMMNLPDDLEKSFRDDVSNFEKENVMPYVTSIERLAKAEGIQEGIREGIREGIQEGERKGLLDAIEMSWRIKFKKSGKRILDLVRQVEDADVLRLVQQAIVKGQSLDDIRRLVGG